MPQCPGLRPSDHLVPVADPGTTPSGHVSAFPLAAFTPTGAVRMVGGPPALVLGPDEPKEAPTAPDFEL